MPRLRTVAVAVALGAGLASLPLAPASSAEVPRSPAAGTSSSLPSVYPVPRSMQGQGPTVVLGRAVALLTSDDADPAAVRVARQVLDDAGVAEVAFEVADAARGAGIGTILLDAVTTVAAARGVRRVRALVLPGNEPSRRMVARLGVHLALVDGLLEGDGPLRLLDPPRVHRQAVVALACRVAAADSQDGPCEAVDA